MSYFPLGVDPAVWLPSMFVEQAGDAGGVELEQAVDQPGSVVVRNTLIWVMTSFTAVLKVPDVQELAVVLQEHVLVRSDVEYMLPLIVAVGSPSVTSITKFCWHEAVMGVLLPTK